MLRHSPEATKRRRVLVSTIAPVIGGIPTMTRFVVRTLRAGGYEPVLAYYEPYSVTPRLSVPSFRLLRGRPGQEERREMDGCEAHAIGAWLPELEFTHYYATEIWKRLIEQSRFHVSVAGNALAALPFHQTGQPFLAWVAAGWHDDRKDRTSHFLPVRKILDTAVVGPIARRLEVSILKSGSILSLSHYTRRILEGLLGGRPITGVLPMPIDTEFFSPEADKRVPGRIGFSGRVDDPRKNVDLLLRALALVRSRRPGATALLIGGEPDERLRRRIAELDLGGAVEFLPYQSTETLRGWLRTLDVLVVPSHQEGLCIAALEAMACGCPVVSTRCGGPEEFIIDGETGTLVDSDPAQMADAICAIIDDPHLRSRLMQGARNIVVSRYSPSKARDIFWAGFNGLTSSAGGGPAHLMHGEVLSTRS